MTWKWKAEGREAEAFVSAAVQAKGRAALKEHWLPLYQVCQILGWTELLPSECSATQGTGSAWQQMFLHCAPKRIESVTCGLRAHYRNQCNFLVLYSTELRTKWWAVLCSIGYRPASRTRVCRDWSAASRGSQALGMLLPALVLVWNFISPLASASYSAGSSCSTKTFEASASGRELVMSSLGFLQQNWVFFARDSIHQQMTRDTGVTEQVTGKQWRSSENYLLCSLLAHQLWVHQMFKGWRYVQVWKAGGGWGGWWKSHMPVLCNSRLCGCWLTAEVSESYVVPG